MYGTRYQQAPFSPAFDFVAARDFVFDGQALKAGDPIDKSKVPTTRLESMFNTRFIRPLTAEEKRDLQIAAPSSRQASRARAAKRAAEASQSAGGTDTAPSGKNAPQKAVSVRHAGFGRYFTVDAAGKDVAGPMGKDEAKQLVEG